MKAAVVCTLAVCASSLPVVESKEDVRYVDASFVPPGQLLGVSFVDVDGDGALEVCLALRAEDGERQLAFYRLGSRGLAPEPFHLVPIFDEVVAYGFADVRDEAGKELFLLMKAGAWSYSLEHEGFRGNLKRLIETDLLYDVADPEELPEWEYVMPREGGDWILLPGPDGYSVFGPRPAGDAQKAAYQRIARYGVEAGSAARKVNADGATVNIQAGNLSIDTGVLAGGGLAPPFVQFGAASASFLSSGQAYNAPALVDVDGDDRVDLVTLEPGKLAIFLSGARFGHEDESGVPVPDRLEIMPGYLKADSESVDLDLRFADLNGDGLVDVLAKLQKDGSGVENAVITLLVLLNDGKRLFPEKPHQVLRFEAADVRIYVTDVDGDGRPDIGFREFVLPSLLGTVTGVEFKLTHLLFLGQESGRPFHRKPVMKVTEEYDETEVQNALAMREWDLDCNGDGIADLVEIDIEGRVSIRRLVRSKSFFGQESWDLEVTPWARFETDGSILDIEVRDLNRDGLGDIVSQDGESLTLLLSTRGGGGR